MTSRFTPIAAAAAVAGAVLFSPATQAASGQALHDKHCLACHGTEVYTRGGRRVGSYPALQTQVARCKGAAGAPWFDEEVAAVVEYLNASFYKFSH